jgi:hypothetical protein
VREAQAKSASGVRQECVSIASELFRVNNFVPCFRLF